MSREVGADAVAEAVAALCVGANTVLGGDIRNALRQAKEREDGALGAYVLEQLLENAKIAEETSVPICQDTGLAVVFADVGQDVRVTGGDLTDAINRGVRKGYEEGFLRKSVVRDPVDRVNTGDNTPAVIHYNIVPGDRLTLTVAPKGFGSENMSRLAMLTPAHGMEGVERFVVETVRLAGPNPCPPVIVGVGVGGTMERCALLAKRALLREIGGENPDPFWAGAEASLLAQVNGLGVGPAGFGGKTTALAVHIETFPTHIAGLPVAVNIGCHVTRHRAAVL